MVVDDEADTRNLLRDLLAGEGFKVVTCEGPRAALKEAKPLKPDLIVLDLSMPEMNGMDLLPRLQLVVPHAKVMILSAYADPETSQEAIREGVAGVLWKPFKTETLLSMVRRILEAA